MKTDYFCLVDNTIDVEADFNLKFDVEADLNITISEIKRIVKVPPSTLWHFELILSIKKYMKSGMNLNKIRMQKFRNLFQRERDPLSNLTLSLLM